MAWNVILRKDLPEIEFLSFFQAKMSTTFFSKNDRRGLKRNRTKGFTGNRVSLVFPSKNLNDFFWSYFSIFRFAIGCLSNIFGIPGPHDWENRYAKFGRAALDSAIFIDFLSFSLCEPR